MQNIRSCTLNLLQTGFFPSSCCLLASSDKMTSQFVHQRYEGDSCCALEVLSDVLLVFIPLLLSELSYFILQLHDGPLDLIVLTDQRHPAVQGRIQMLQHRKI